MSPIFLTHAYFLQEDPKELEIMKPYPPLGILYISAYLEEHGFNSRVFDSTFSTFEKLCAELISVKPEILGIYTNLMTKLNVLRIIQFVKTSSELKHTRIILGGPEVRNHSEKFLRYGADVIVVGEGEETMLELVTHFTENKSGEADSTNGLKTISGISFIDSEKNAVTTPGRSLLRDMDQLPFPNRKKIDLHLYFDAWKNRHGESTISVSTMRGCPYTCKWCSRAVYGQSYRRRSAVKAVDELQTLQSAYQFDTIWFVDDVFTISHVWLQEFRDEIVRRKIAVRFECITRADRMNDLAIRLLKESGCFRVWIGAESGSQTILDAMDRRVKVEQVGEMIRKSKSAGIQTGTFIMVGYPGETESDIESTIAHLKSSDPDLYTITVAYPIKGTELYAQTESGFREQLPWETSTDRQIDFARTYSRRYYEFAIRRVYNEVAFFKTQKNNKAKFFRLTKFKLKSLLAKGGMLWERSFS